VYSTCASMRRVRLKQPARDLFIKIGEVLDVELGDEQGASTRVQPLAHVCKEGEEAVAVQVQYATLRRRGSSEGGML
jgi:hypothetical protein